MDKKALSERDICTKFISPAIERAGWDMQNQLREEVYITKGRILVRGRMTKRAAGKRVDYILYYKANIPIAIVEAKDNNHALGAGMQQALEYGEMIDVPFIFSSNGDGFLFHDRTGLSDALERELPLDQFPSPKDLWRRYCKHKGFTPEIEAVVSQDYYSDGSACAAERDRSRGCETARCVEHVCAPRPRDRDAIRDGKEMRSDAEETPVLRIPNVVRGTLDLEDLKYTKFPGDELAELMLRDGDLLVVRSNGSRDLVGRAAVVDHRAAGFAFAGYLIRVRLRTDLVLPAWVKLALDSTPVRRAVEGPARTTSGVHNVNTKELLSLQIPLPPLESQRATLQTVGRIMKVCADLEAKLREAEGRAAKLVEAVVQELVA